MISKKGLSYYIQKITTMVNDAYAYRQSSSLSLKEIYQAMYWRKIPKISNSVRLLGGSYQEILSSLLQKKEGKHEKE